LRFTKLRLNGFKSFVDPTDLVIHDGLTGVVGPNGCGKSNLLEALRWVMGENRPTAMRGGGMEDVIFNGAATRGARHFAEVALVMDNSDRLAPSGFNDSRHDRNHPPHHPRCRVGLQAELQGRAGPRCTDAVCRCLHRGA
jgi:chromosome segregation protein